MPAACRSFRWISSAGLVILFAGACAGAKGRAESDLAAAERAIAALPADAAKVVPDELSPLSEAVNQAKDQLAKGDYAAASATAQGIPAKASALGDSLPARKAVLVAVMDTLSVAMPRNLAAIKGKLDTIALAKRLPRGLDEQELQEAKDTHAAATAEWADIMSAFQAGELANAMGRALALKNRVSHSLMALGLVSDERAWSNVTLPPS